MRFWPEFPGLGPEEFEKILYRYFVLRCKLRGIRINNKMDMGADVGVVGSVGKVVGAKLTRNEIGQINKLVETGIYLNPSDFIRDAVREKLAAIKVIEYRDVDYEIAKKEVAGYFQMKTLPRQ